MRSLLPLARLPRIAALCAAGLLLAACSGNKNIDPPAELTDFQTKIQVQRVWTGGLGDGEPRLRLGFAVATDDERAFTASRDGEVAAYALANGRRLWRTNTRLKLAGGPGTGSGLVIVGSSDGDIVALDVATGQQRWKTRVNSELLSAPAVDGELVVVRAADGRIFGLAAGDGRQLWNAEQQVPRLSLRGTATPLISGDIVACGFDNGRVLGLNRRDGTTAWEVTVAPPSGRSELERLVDIDSAIKQGDEDLYVVTFQGRLARIARDTGQVWWTREMSSYRGLAVDAESVYVATSNGEVVKVSRRTGAEEWRQKVLSNRRLSAPALFQGQVVVADFEGYVHFLDAATGELSARIGTGGDRVSAAPVVVGDELLVLNDEGKLVALRVRAPRA